MLWTSRSPSTNIKGCEGYLDVIALHQDGFHRVVAPLGTAVTLDHLVSVFKYSDELVLCLDADRAVRHALWCWHINGFQ